MRICRELEQETEFKEYLDYVKGAHSRLFLKFHSGTNYGLFEELGRHKVGGSKKCPKCGACNEVCKESVEHVLFECASYDSQRLDFLGYLKTVLPPDAFEAFLCGSILDKIAFCLGESKVCW